MEYPLSGILNGSAIITEGAQLRDIRMLRVNHLSTTKPQASLHWGHAWDGSGTRCADRCGAATWYFHHTQRYTLPPYTCFTMKTLEFLAVKRSQVQ